MAWQSRFAGQKCSQSFSLIHVQDGDRSRSARTKTSHSSLTTPWILWARSPDNVLSSWQYQPSHFCNCWSCRERKSGGSRTLAILHTTYRFTMRLVSAHISQWDVKFAGEWDSALKGNSALSLHVARAGIGLAHSEGQYVIHFRRDTRKFYDSIKAHLLIPQLVARGYPLQILVLGSLTHKSPRCLQVGNGYSDIITLGSEVFCLNWSKHWSMRFLDRFAKSTSMIRLNLFRIRVAYNCHTMRR